MSLLLLLRPSTVSVPDVPLALDARPLLVSWQAREALTSWSAYRLLGTPGGPGPVRTLSALSTQDVWAPIRSEDPETGLADNLSATTVSLAFTVPGTNPVAGDWDTATWETLTPTIGGKAWYLARLLVGPSPGVVTLTPGLWACWYRVVSGSQTAIEQFDAVRVY